MYRAVKLRLYPTKAQAELIDKSIGCARWIYNHFLAQRIKQYEETGKSDSAYAQMRQIKDLRKAEETEWLSEVSRKSLDGALMNLDAAYKNFFRRVKQGGKTGFPRFKRKCSPGSFSNSEGASIIGNRIKIPKFREGIRFKCGNVDFSNMKPSVTVSRSATSKYYASVLCEFTPNKITPCGSIGIDMGVKDFAVTSDGEVYSGVKYFEKLSRKLAMAQKHLSRKKKGSNSYKRQKLKVARIHEKIANCRRDMQHKISREIVNQNGFIAVEDLNIKGMMKNRRLAKHIADRSIYSFITMLEYKSEWQGGEVVKVGRFFPSSKTCNQCGHKNNNLKLSDRHWKCDGCGALLDRDINAAKNILDEALRIKSAGCVDNTGGGDVRLESGLPDKAIA